MKNIVFKLTSVLAMILLLCGAAVAWGQASQKPDGGEDPSIVTSELDEFDLVVKVRPILPKITTKDPLRIAVHFETKNGPIDHTHEKLGQQLLNRQATLGTMDIAIRGPGGDWKMFKATVDADANERQSSLAMDGTLLLELGSESIKSLRLGGQEEFAMPWKWDGMLKPGEYQIALRGTLKLSTRERTVRQRGKPEEKFPATTTDVDFKTPPISIEVARADMRTQSLEELTVAAVAAVKDHPDIEKERLTVQDAESIPIADKDGNIVIRVRANLPPLPPDAPRIGGGIGYWQYEVAIARDGKPAGIARWRKGFCVARGTRISTPDGEIAVEQLYSGQHVWAYDVKQGSLVSATVLAVRSSLAQQTILLNDRLRLTPEHPVLVVKERGTSWQLAGDIRADDKLLNFERRPIRVSSVGLRGGNVEVFDVAVDGPHNFFAAGLLVHNKSIAWTPQAFVPWYALWNRAPVK